MDSAKNSKKYVAHPLVRDSVVEKRLYQEVIVARALKRNLMCVLPTGLGKTAVALLLSAYRLEKFPDSKILMVAPTKPLVEQHRKTFCDLLRLNEEDLCVLTGKIAPEDRKKLWDNAKIFFATPQVVENDLVTKKVSFKNFSLLVVDECHRATKGYPYVFIANRYFKQSSKPRILGLTASPGGKEEVIKQVAENLFIEDFEIRTDDDSDVKQYIQDKEVSWITVPLTRNFERIKKNLDLAFKNRLKKLKEMRFLDSVTRVKKRDLLKLRGSISSQLSNKKDPSLYRAISIVAACIKLQYALELLQTQGILPLYKYLTKLKKERSKAAKRMLNDPLIQNVCAITEWMYNNGEDHPKLGKLKESLREFEGKCIVFTQYRNTVDLIFQHLDEFENLKPVKFKGQKQGFTQKKQLEILNKFRKGEFNVLISTSVGEEGLDIPNVDLVIFYEPIPSEIRSIQRRGRTARHKSGKICVLMAENTLDEAYYWSSYHKERRMKNTLKNLKNNSFEMKSKKQRSLDFYVNEGEIVVYCDDRERKIIKLLSKKEVLVRPNRLEVADFIVSDRTAIERKSSNDLLNSIIDQRLFNQIKSLKDQFELPILIIEGKEFNKRAVHPNALWGAISCIILDYQIPVLWSKNLDETVDIIISLAKREQQKSKKSFSIRGKKASMTTEDLQKYIVSGLPNINNLLSERLLNHFGSIKQIFNASETELKKIKGLGKEKSKKIKDIINKNYEE